MADKTCKICSGELQHFDEQLDKRQFSDPQESPNVYWCPNCGAISHVFTTGGFFKKRTTETVCPGMTAERYGIAEGYSVVTEDAR